MIFDFAFQYTNKNQYNLGKVNHEPIIDEDLFNRVQTVFDRRKVQPASKKKSNELPLMGKFVCTVYGHKLACRKSRGNGADSGHRDPSISVIAFNTERQMLRHATT